MALIAYCGRKYVAEKCDDGRIAVSVVFTSGTFRSDVLEDEAKAYAWLGNNGLRRSKIKKLLGLVGGKEDVFDEG